MRHAALGTPAHRAEGPDKVTGAARYAGDHAPADCAHAWPVPATIPRGRVVSVDTAPALALPGVLAVLTPHDAPRLGPSDDPTLQLLQDTAVPHRGWYVALAVAQTPEAARAAAAAVRVAYAAEEHDSVLRADHPDAYTPQEANGGHPAHREQGDPDAALAAAPVRIDCTYTVPPLHNHPMEPHSATAVWDAAEGHLTVYDSSQGSGAVRSALAGLFDLPEDRVTVVSEHVGGGFGSKGTPRPHVVLAAMATRQTGRPVTLALPRRHLPAVVGHRAPSLHRIRLGARPDGTLTGLVHEVTTHTSRVREFVEQAAVPGRVMYAVPDSRTTHRAVALDVPTPSWMRAPGEAPGMYVLESAMDELADALGIDPVELRVRNEPATEPDSGRPFSSRHLVECLREGAERFGWASLRTAPRREGPVLSGVGVAAATYPVLIAPSSARAHARPDGSYLVEVNATDIGTGARTVLAQVAADALHVPLDAVTVVIGHTGLPPAPLAGGSSGTASWGWAVHDACEALTARVAGHPGPLPARGLSASADTTQSAGQRSPYARHAFGAQFAEVRVDTVTGEVRVHRLLGVFAAGRILNPVTARSQFVGAMVMGVGMALTEHSTVDPVHGDFAESDLAAYHVPVSADVPDVEAHWIDEHDKHLNPMGSKGIGEIGITGAAAAIGNAFCHATGRRLRGLPLTPDRVLDVLG
ncbi:xanthine dehydrogenase family protein molybdopterin-binding subunit [Streptomyces sp. NPDC058655]|uniref:xanthine dehydrogenase family protein molybdopterin-binding subunit n=1 Tax=unclassified Streptomyces TaxID=2593676 RepID=UPI00365CF438